MTEQSTFARNQRHTAASQAVMVGENRPLVGKLLGHHTTAGSAHRADAHLVEAAEKAGSRIAAAMRGAEAHDARAARQSGPRFGKVRAAPGTADAAPVTT